MQIEKIEKMTFIRRYYQNSLDKVNQKKRAIFLKKSLKIDKIIKKKG